MRHNRTRHDPFQRGHAHLLSQRLDHGMSGLADGNYYDPRISLQIVEILANAQNPALTVHMSGKSRGDRRLGQRVEKNLTGGLADVAKLRFAIVIRHGENYKRTCSSAGVSPTLVIS